MQHLQPQNKIMDCFDFSLCLTATPFAVRKAIEDEAIQEAEKYVLKHGDKTISVADTLANKYVKITFKKFTKQIKEEWAETLNALPMNERQPYEITLNTYVESVKHSCFDTELFNRIKAIFTHKPS